MSLGVGVREAEKVKGEKRVQNNVMKEGKEEGKGTIGRVRLGGSGREAEQVRGGRGNSRA